MLVFEHSVVVWLVLTIVLAVIEAVTVGLVTIWFAAGAFVALLAATFGAQLWLQIILFVATSAILLIFTRPLVRKHLTGKLQPTNADMVIGKVCIVTEDIDNLQAKGAVSCMGKEWSARTENGEPVSAGEKVTVKEISGVKLIVSPINEMSNL